MKKKYTETKRFLKLKAEYLKEDDKYIERKIKKTSKWLTTDTANELLKNLREGY